ncbi:MAG: response regulator [Clostridiales bacterium]
MRKKFHNSKKNNMNILVLDDEIGILKIIKTNVEKNGYNCIITDDHIEAIKIIRNNNPKIDIFITDYLMIDITAEEIIEEVRSFNKDIYIILQTGYFQNIPGLYAMKNFDIDSFVEKDTDFEDLLIKIEIGAKCLKRIYK